MGETADITGQALKALLAQADGPIIVLLILAVIGQFFLGRRDNAKSAKALADEKDEHLEDVKQANDRYNQIIGLVAPRPRGK